jgi:phage tail sheath protein FI
MATAFLSPGVYVVEVPSAIQTIAGVGTSTAAFIGIAPDRVDIPEANPDYDPTLKVAPPAPRPDRPQTVKEGGEPGKEETVPPTPSGKRGRAAEPENTNLPYRMGGTDLQSPSGEVRLCTNWTEFKRYFGDFSTDRGQNILAHAVYGFFGNGGRRCYVARVANATQIPDVLQKLEAIDEIAMVAAPGITDDATRAAILQHCDTTQDRFAIFDTPENVPKVDQSILPGSSKNAALYFPWVLVADPVDKALHPDERGAVYVPPSGHIAGIYARVDTQRGVFKAPANEKVAGALGVNYAITRNQQDGLNPIGVNCIREFNGDFLVWGARTMGADRNGEWRYVSTRRLFLFLRKSIEDGTNWAVFEPNDKALWERIKLNVGGFLKRVYDSGALFGATPAQAYYVKCDEETNPPDVREIGQVVTEIGVAITRPAEFVIFHISQWRPAAK